LGQAGLQDPRDLGLRLCHSQTTWVTLPFPAPSFLGLEGMTQVNNNNNN